MPARGVRDDGGEYLRDPRSAMVRGRGTGLRPTNRFETRDQHTSGEYLDHLSAEAAAEAAGGVDAAVRETAQSRTVALPQAVPVIRPETTVLPDQTRSLINRVDSPDIPMAWSVNPYRGCEHGCIYCYARPGHEYLAMSSGLDFETKIMVKHDAPAILLRELARPQWKGEPLAFSGVTDCYQPIEREFRITRGCLEVCLRHHQPVTIITKNHLVTRDIDLFREFAKWNGVHVGVSVTTLDHRLAAKMEPRASAPADRLRAIRELSDAGVPVAVMAAPMIPGINDREMPAILKAAAEAGARQAGFVMLRLPYQIKELFLDWLRRHFPDRAAHVENLVRDVRGGLLNDPNYGSRMRGTGPVAEVIRRTYTVFRRRYGLDAPFAGLNSTLFVRPELSREMKGGEAGQMRLFE